MMRSLMTSSLLAALMMSLCVAACSNGMKAPPGAANHEQKDAEAPDAGADASDASRSDAADGEAPDVDAIDDADAESALSLACATAKRRARDTDQDGLTDCEELRYEGQCLDINLIDTDDDGLSDYEEFSVGSDPCLADSDADGLSDGEEVALGLDPLRGSTYENGVLDGSLYIARACDEVEADPTEFYASPGGGWLMAVPSVFNYVPITLAGGVSRGGAAAFGDPVSQVFGVIFSIPKSGDARSASDELATYRAKIVDSIGEVSLALLEGEFETHSGDRAAPGIYRVRAHEARSVKSARDEVFFALSSLERAETGGLPSADGNHYTEFFLEVTVLEWSDRLITVAAIAPSALRESSDTVRARLSDLTNATNIAPITRGHRLRCHRFIFEPRAAQADFYWVLDQSKTMDRYYDEMRAFASNFYAKLENAGLDFRFGVTPMESDPAYAGRLRMPPEGPGWISEASASAEGVVADFIREIEEYVVGCEDLSPECSQNLEYGLYAGSAGIERMRSTSASEEERFRPGAQVVTIMMTDEEDESYESPVRSPRALSTPELVLDFYQHFFPTYDALLFAIHSPADAPCPEAAEHAVAYPQVAFASGGASASICQDLEETIDAIIEITAGEASNYELPQIPISSTLRVYQTSARGSIKRWVPRSRSDGFDYFPRSNAIALFGTYRMPRASRARCRSDRQCAREEEVCRDEICQSADPPHLAVHYRTFRRYIKD